MRHRRTLPGLVCLGLLVLAGCSVSPLAKNTADFSGATALVVDSTRNAYRTAVRLNEDAQASLLVARYDSDQPMDPHSIRPLIDDKGIKTRTEVLEGLRVYAQSIADISAGVSSPELDQAAAACGTNLQSLGNSLAASTPIGINVTPTEASGASTAFKALGEFLIAHKIKSSVPRVIRDMDPSIDALTKLLLSDLDLLRDQAGRDYEEILARQDSFIRHAQNGLSPTERRAEIRRIPRILASKKATDDMLADLQDSIRKLAETHHALAAAASSKDTTALRARIAELTASAKELNAYYNSLAAASAAATASTTP